MLISDLLDSLEEAFDLSGDDPFVSLGQMQTFLVMLRDHWKDRGLLRELRLSVRGGWLLILVALHSIGLARACLAVDKNCSIKTLCNSIYKGRDI